MSIRASMRSVLVGAALLAATGCATTTQYARFAQAGSAYATALDQLLVAAGTTGIDATSERLLQDDAEKNQDLASYQALTEIDTDRLATIGRLRTHAHLLAVYFALLNALATSDAPERLHGAVAGVIDSLNSLGNQLRSGPLVHQRDVVAGATKLAVMSSRKAALRRELEERKDTVRLELMTEELLLTRLADAIAHDLQLVRSAREQRLVIAPLVDAAKISRPDEWAANRRRVLTMQTAVDELARASDAGAQLRQAFEDLISGKATLARIDALLASVDGLLAVAASVTR